MGNGVGFIEGGAEVALFSKSGRPLRPDPPDPRFPWGEHECDLLPSLLLKPCMRGRFSAWAQCTQAGQRRRPEYQK